MVYNSKDLSKGLFWSLLDKFGFVFLQLLLEIILARLLLPKDYGVIGIVLVVISFSVTLSEGGFSNALIQKQNRDETDFSTVFYFNIFIAVLIYGIIYFVSPLLETFFRIPDLTLILRIVSLSIIFNASVLVHKTKQSISMDFKLQAKLSLLAVFISGIIGVLLAYKGFGVWALVYQNLSLAFFNAVFLWIGYFWIPQKIFSWVALQSMFSFGSRIMASSIIQSIYFNAYPVLIGRMMGTRDLGFYSKSSQFTQMPSSLLTTIIQRVLFPYFSSYQNDNGKIFTLNQHYTKICCIIFFPIFFIMATVSKPLVIVLFSEKWVEMSTLFLLLCLAYSFYPLIVNNMMLFQVKNKASLFLKIEILTKIVGVAILIITIQQGIIAVGIGIMAQQVIQFLITSYFVQKMLQKSIMAQLKIIFPLLLVSVAIFVGVNYFLEKTNFENFPKIFFGVLLCLVAYASVFILFYKKFIQQMILMIKK